MTGSGNNSRIFQARKIFIIDKLNRRSNPDPQKVDEHLNLLKTSLLASKSREIKLSINNNGHDRKKLKILSEHKKRPWTKDEDSCVRRLVFEHGYQWAKIERLIKSRNGKQIRDRYLNYINPSTKRDRFTKEEDDLIKDLYLKYGSRWSYIAKYCSGRTGDLVKNRFNTCLLYTSPSPRD